jgi:hypothetical protein
MMPLPWMTLVGAVAIYAATMTFLYKDAVDDLSDIKSALALAEKQAAETRQDHERNLQALAAGWDSAVRALDRAPVIRVRKADCVRQSPLPVATGITPGHAPKLGLAASVFDPVEISLAECEDRLNASLKASAQVLHLLDFIYLSHEASK